MIENWIKYWRNSLADGDRMERNLKKTEYYELEKLDLSQGRLPVENTGKLIDKYEEKINKLRGADGLEDED